MPRLPRTAAADSQPEAHPEPRAPGALLMLLEARAPLELGALLASTPWLRRLPRGDGHPVLVFPGMCANDTTTVPLRKFLDRLGYATQAWGQGFNLGPRAGVLEQCAADVQALADRHGRPVSLVGWSLGGLYAREISKQLPDRTRSVVTLGTPFSGPPRATNAWRLFELLSGRKADEPALLASLCEPPPVPTTSIYSRTDGIVSWKCSLNQPGSMAENIEVHASHTGMVVNPWALYALADRLAQPPGGWRPFAPIGARRWFFGPRTSALHPAN